MLLEMAGLPHMQAGGKPPSISHQQAAQMAAKYNGMTPKPDLRGYIPPDFIPVYRPDVKGKYGGKEGLETMPTYLDKMQIQEYVRAMRGGEPHGVPQLPPEYLANMALREGRSDFGFNQINHHNPKAMNISKTLATSGQHEDPASDFAGAIHDKMATAMRLKKPFSTVWNGTGVNDYGQSGKQYTDAFTAGFPATMHPKNAALLAAIKEAYENNPQVAQQEPATMPAVDTMSNVTGFNQGGVVHMNEGGMAFPEDIQRGLAEGRITQNQAEYIHNARLNPVPAHWGDHMSYQDRYLDSLEPRPKYVPPTEQEIRIKEFLDKQDPIKQSNTDMNREQLRKYALQTENPATFRSNPARVGGGGGGGGGATDIKQFMNPRNIAYANGGSTTPFYDMSRLLIQKHIGN